MKILYIQQLSPDIEEVKEKSGGRLDGALVFCAEAIQAIVRYSNYDLILFPRCPVQPAGDLRKTTVFAQQAKRIRFVNEQELSALPASRTVTLASLTFGLEELAKIRGVVLRRAAPATGMIHSLYGTSLLQGFMSLFLADVRGCDALICSSSAGQRAVRNIMELIGEKLREVGANISAPALSLPIIPLGIDVSKYVPPPERTNAEVCVLYVGRISLRSKADLRPLLIAWREIQRERIAAKLVIAGDDSQGASGSLRAFAADLGCQETLEIVTNPARDVKLDLYRRANVFVSPSDTLQETFGLTIVEAMACGLPVIASDWSGYRDIIVNGRTGFLVPTSLPGSVTGERHCGECTLPGSIVASSTVVDTHALLKCLRTLLLSSETRMRLGIAGRLLAEQCFDWRVVVKKYEELWDYLSANARVQSNLVPSIAINQFCLDRVFGHYATQVIALDTVVQHGWISAEADNACILNAALADGFSHRWAQIILNCIPPHGVSVQKLHDCIGEKSLSMSELIMCLGRLAKYGLVAFSISPSKLQDNENGCSTLEKVDALLTASA